MIYVLDADQNGTDSYQFLVDAGYVKHIPIVAYEQFDQVIAWLVNHIVADQDIIVIDTVDALAATTRGDSKMGTDHTENLWDKRHLWSEGYKGYLSDYDYSAQVINRRIRNVRAAGARVILTAHEGDMQDMGMKKRGPAMSKGLYNAVKSVTSDIFRLHILEHPVMGQDGVVRYAAGTRLATIKTNATMIAKNHVDPFAAEALPETIPIENVFVPVLPKIYSYLWKLPSCVLLYGEPGVGKSTSAVSEAFAMFLQHLYPDRWQKALALFNQEPRQSHQIVTPTIHTMIQ